jgi:hypothetical protein
MVTRETNRVSALREDAEDEAARIRSSFQGYTAEQIGEALEGEPLAERFRQNPYILPALQVHRGRVTADELATSMVEAGIDPSDTEAVNEFLQANQPDNNDGFFARGLNEQLDRYRSQWTQMQIRGSLEQAEYERTAAAGREFQTVFEDTQDIGTAIEALRTAELDLEGYQVTDILVGQMRSAAQRGDKDFVEALATYQRDNGLSLADDANVAEDVAAYREQAALRWRQDQSERWTETRTAFFDIIDQGTTRRALENDPRFEELPAGIRGQIIERWRSDRDQRRSEARRGAASHWQATQRSEIGSRALDLLVNGRAEEIDDVTIVDEETGASVYMSRNQQIEAGVRIFRSQYLGENPLAVPAEEGEKYRIYTQRLADGDLHDPMLQGYLDGLGAMMTTEGIVSGAPEVAQGYTMYSNMDPVTARRYVTDTRSRSVFQTMDRLIQRDPELAPEEAAARAVAITSQERPRLSSDSRVLREAVNGLEIEDPLNSRRNWHFARRNEEMAPEAAVATAWIADRANEYTAFMSETDALEAARTDYQSEHTVVNGRVVALPNGPSGDATRSRETPESWARRATDYLNGVARADGSESIEGYSLRHGEGNAYWLITPSGDATPISAAQIRRGARVYAAYNASEEAEERRAEQLSAAEEALSNQTPEFPEYVPVRPF